GLYTVRWKHRPALGAEKSARGLVHGLAQLDRNLLITVAAQPLRAGIKPNSGFLCCAERLSPQQHEAGSVRFANMNQAEGCIS
ncbi:MAG: hypothetical protein AAGH90_04180, partial [Pseudomonadota bacterium]